MKLIAITGGIGCGKSVVSEILRRMGLYVYDTDSEAKRLMDSNPDIIQRIAKSISRRVVTKNGELIRSELANIVFSNPDKLQRLNNIVHSAVVDDVLCTFASLKAPVMFVETALLYQSGLDKHVDEVWEVTAPESLRILRVMGRNACSSADVEARIDAQRFTPANLHSRVKTIVNDGITPLLPQVESLLSEVVDVRPAQRAVLFDLDGVLIDSEGVYTQCWEDIDRTFPTGVKDFAHVIKGNTLEKILTTYFPASVHAEIVKRLDTFEETMEYPLFPGVVQLLNALRANGFRTAIVTSSSQRKMQSLYRQIPQFASWVDTVVTGTDVTFSKPHPQGYLLAAERLGCDSANCIVVEDSIQGLEAGMRAGAKVLGIATTNPIAAIKEKAHQVAGSISEVTVDSLLRML